MLGLILPSPLRRCNMYSTVMLVILLFPWTILGIMAIGNLGRRLHKVPVRSR